MSSKRRIRRLNERKCQSKRQYDDQETARLAAWKRGNIIGHRLNAYKCKVCNTWHIGHTPRRIIQSIIAKVTGHG